MKENLDVYIDEPYIFRKETLNKPNVIWCNPTKSM